ncbi:MAG: hypothetical protein H0W72_09595 [Planctomycetes bacterium]|nr:hypothetical protein [Planctomycetota bacterium]
MTEAARSCWEAAGDNPAVIDTYAETLLAQGDAAGCIALLDRQPALVVQVAQLQVIRGRALEALADRAGALTAFQAALHLAKNLEPWPLREPRAELEKRITKLGSG